MGEFKVLVVDDEQEFRELTTRRLRRNGLEASCAENGNEALEVLEKDSFIDVVLLDVKMPGIDGIETLRRVRQLRPLVEVVLLTGHASVESGIEGMKLGAFDYLMKPIDLESLIEKLGEAYERKKIHEKKIEQAQIKKFMAMPI